MEEKVIISMGGEFAAPSLKEHDLVIGAVDRAPYGRRICRPLIEGLSS